MHQAERKQRFALWVKDHRAILHHAVNAFAYNDERDDLMQEILLAIWTAIPSFAGNSQPATFIYRVAHNCAMTWQRRQGRRQQHEIPALADPVAENPDLQRKGQLELLYQQIQCFPALDRSLLLLWLDEVDYRQMAEIHGISESLVGVRLNRARNRLIEELQEQTKEQKR